MFLIVKTLFLCVALLEATKIKAYENRFGLEFVEASNAFVATISLGSPPQSLNVAFDFNSSLLWVPQRGCSCAAECARVPEDLCYDICSMHCCLDRGNHTTPEDFNEKAMAGECTRKNVFNPTLSETYFSRKRSVEIPYENSRLSLNLAYDTLRFGPHHKPALNVQNFMFAHTNKLPEKYGDQQYDGVFGLGRVGPRDAKSPIQQLAEKRVFGSPVVTFSFQLDHPFYSYDAVVTFGDVDDSDCDFGPSTYIPLLTKTDWSFRIFSVNLNSTEEYGMARFSSFLNPSSPYFHMPSLLFDSIRKEISIENGTGKHIMDCAAASRVFSSFSVNFGNQGSYAVPLRQVVRGHTEKLCEVLVRESHQNQFILGRPFLNRRCVVLDYNGRVGISNYRW